MTSGKYSVTWLAISLLLLSALFNVTKAGAVGFNISDFKMNLKHRYGNICYSTVTYKVFIEQTNIIESAPKQSRPILRK